MRKIDKVRSGKLKRAEFIWGIKEAGQFLSKHDLDKLFKYFDKKCEDVVNYEEFLTFVNGNLGNARLDIVRSVFSNISGGAGAINFKAL